MLNLELVSESENGASGADIPRRERGEHEHEEERGQEDELVLGEWRSHDRMPWPPHDDSDGRDQQRSKIELHLGEEAAAHSEDAAAGCGKQKDRCSAERAVRYHEAQPAKPSDDTREGVAEVEPLEVDQCKAGSDANKARDRHEDAVPDDGMVECGHGDNEVDDGHRGSGVERGVEQSQPLTNVRRLFRPHPDREHSSWELSNLPTHSPPPCRSIPHRCHVHHC
jgi:hypothetical protein